MSLSKACIQLEPILSSVADSWLKSNDSNGLFPYNENDVDKNRAKVILPSRTDSLLFGADNLIPMDETRTSPRRKKNVTMTPRICWKEGLLVLVCSGKTTVSSRKNAEVVLNGQEIPIETEEVALKHGDWIALAKTDFLLGPVQLFYSYRVRILEEEEKSSKSPAKRKLAATPPAREKQASTTKTLLLSSLSEDFLCPVCLDIMVEATTLAPCGHSFCASCIKSMNSSCCPCCQAKIQNKSLSHTINQTIAKLVQMPVFVETDVEFYHSRKDNYKRRKHLVDSPRVRNFFQPRVVPRTSPRLQARQTARSRSPTQRQRTSLGVSPRNAILID